MSVIRHIIIVQGTRPEDHQELCVREGATRGQPALQRAAHQPACGRRNVQRGLRRHGLPADGELPADYRIGVAIDWLEHEFHEARHLARGDQRRHRGLAPAGAVARALRRAAFRSTSRPGCARATCMLEERNRIMVDAVAELLFAYTALEAGVLRDSADDARPGARGQHHGGPDPRLRAPAG